MLVKSLHGASGERSQFTLPSAWPQPPSHRLTPSMSSDSLASEKIPFMSPSILEVRVCLCITHAGPELFDCLLVWGSLAFFILSPRPAWRPLVGCKDLKSLSPSEYTACSCPTIVKTLIFFCSGVWVCVAPPSPTCRCRQLSARLWGPVVRPTLSHHQSAQPSKLVPPHSESVPSQVQRSLLHRCWKLSQITAPQHSHPPTSLS